jgi:hypothetical protein
VFDWLSPDTAGADIHVILDNYATHKHPILAKIERARAALASPSLIK